MNAAHSTDALQTQLMAFAQRRLATWTGLAPDARIGEARRVLGLHGAVEGRGTVGSAGHEAQWESLYDRPLVLWHRSDELVLLDFEGPFDDLDVMGELGPPAARLDVNWGMAPLPQGEWVYPERGLAAVVSPQGSALRLFGFAAMPLEAYQRDLRRNPTSRPVPPPAPAPAHGGGAASRKPKS